MKWSRTSFLLCSLIVAGAALLSGISAQAQMPGPPPGGFPEFPRGPRRGQLRNPTPEEEATALEFIRRIDSSRVEQVIALKNSRPHAYRAMILRSLNMERHARAMGRGGDPNEIRQSEQLFRRMFELREQMDRLSIQYRLATEENAKNEIRARLSARAGELFDVQTEMNRLQIEQIADELRRLQQRLEQRQAVRDTHIRRQLEMMLSDEEPD
ncbi:MAG TPA: hypothetical protein PLE60_02500 [Candidatus Latescibacteria bacterium]|nr:hypothetical protein [Candidatus Latescibacterota bacterium]